MGKDRADKLLLFIFILYTDTVTRRAELIYNMGRNLGIM